MALGLAHTFMQIMLELQFPVLIHFLGSGKRLDGSFCLFHATALEFYYNFSFAAQLKSIFMLLNDAALSTREWHFRAVSAIRKNLGQIKLLVLWVWFGFRLGKGEEESSQGLIFVLSGLLKLCPIEKTIHLSPGSERRPSSQMFLVTTEQLSSDYK